MSVLAAAWLPHLAGAQQTHYDGVDPYEEYGKRIKSAQGISPLGDSVFGDNVSLYNGATTFQATDVSIPGNSALPVALAREMVVRDLRLQPPGGDGLGGFGDWDLDVPYIDGTFTKENGWTLYSITPGSTNRCSDNVHWPYTRVSIPGGSGFAPYGQIWDGNHLHIPGQGNQQLLANNQTKSPAQGSAGTYKWVTTGNWKLSCTASVTNLAGEGFVALSPSGVRYTFNYAVTKPSSTLTFQYNPKVTPAGVARIRIFLMATQVEDRFGNWVKYSYSGSHLVGITSSDGRSITINWSGDTISSVKSALGTWTYGYSTASWTNNLGGTVTWTYLSKVTRPDGSKWSYAVNSGARRTNKEDWPDDSAPRPNHCQLSALPNSGAFDYTITTPSGAAADYSFKYGRFFRSMVPFGCVNDPSPNHDYPLDATNFFDGFYLASKRISGPGLATETWNYDYNNQGAGSYFDATTPWIDIADTQPYIPPGSCSNCAVSKVVTVTGPVNITKYTYGIQYARNEGQLLQTQVTDLSGNVLKTTVNTYTSDAQAPNQPFANVAGYDLRPSYMDPMGNRNRPVTKTVIAQDGATFTHAVSKFDVFARPASETGSSSLGYSRTEQTSYYDNTSLWVLGQVAKSTIAGMVAAQTTFDSGTALPLNTYQFGRLVATNAWNTDGTLHSVTDGNGHATTLSDWKRGLPQTVTQADKSRESAAVNDAGWITSVTDENGFTTGYGYDAMGRLSSITYPTGDDVAWSQTRLSFAQASGSEYGIPAGHWKQSTNTGNGYTVTYFDAFWRPLLVEHYDAGNKAATLSQIVQRYDAGGRKVFVSYPANNITSYSAANIGTHTTYDALGRILKEDRDSELGDLPTTTAYLSGFETKVTDPRGNSTTTSYQAFGEPSTEWPVSITAPQGELSIIVRDAFGKPLSVTRTGSAQGSPQLTRSYVYDGYQQLCKRIEPETGATAFGYDGAGNLAWSASGLSLPDTGSCDASAAQSSGRVARRSYDARDRVIALTYADGASDTSYGYAPDGALTSQTIDNDGHPVTTLYSYDKRRLLTQETLSIPGIKKLSIGYGYDANGHLGATTWPDGRTLTYAPNALGQPTRAGSYASNASYHPSGALASFTYGSGAVHTMSENQRGLPSGSTDVLDGKAGMSLGYDYDSNGNVAAISDFLPGGVGDVDMTYDPLDRLTKAESPMFGGDGKASYGYDLLDNLVAARLGNISNFTYGYNANNQLIGLVDAGTGKTASSYRYDVQGNLAAKNQQLYQFDQANRLRAVPGIASYLYDAAGRRVQKVETTAGKLLASQYNRAGQLMFQWNPATQDATDYIYLGSTLVARVVGNSSTVIGTVEGVSSAATPTVNGWACSTGIASPISVELYAGGPSGQGTRIATVTANQKSDSTIASQCQSNGTTYRFSIPLDKSMRDKYGGQAIYMYGESPVGNGNKVLSGSGSYSIPPNPTAPQPPASITVPASSNTGSVTVSWTSSSGATSYVLQQQLNGGTWTQVYSGTATSRAISGLSGGTYVYRVEACNTNGCSGFTTSGNLVVALKPGTPSSISVPASSSTGSITVSWSASTGATTYVLQQQLNGGSWKQVYNGSHTSFAASGLGDGSYVYEVKACNASGCSAWKTSGTLKVALIPPVPASISAPGSSSTGSFKVSWGASSGATSYVLQQQLNGGSWSQAYSGSATSKSFSGVGNGSYVYRVKACNGNGCSGWRTSNALKVALIPAPPATITVPASSYSASFNVSWKSSANATNYVLEERVNNGDWGVAWNGSATSTKVTVDSSGTYQFQVAACGAGGCSAFTASGNVAVTLPPGASSLSGPSSSSTGTFTLKWSSVSGATSYQLHQVSGSTDTVVYKGSSRTWTSNALMGGSYVYHVNACNAAGCGPASNKITVKVAAHVPAAPAQVTVPAQVKLRTPFGVSWSSVSGATRYELNQKDIDRSIGGGLVYSGPGTSTAVTLAGGAGDIIKFSARACNSAGCSGWTDAYTYVQGAGAPKLVPVPARSVGP